MSDNGEADRTRSMQGRNAGFVTRLMAAIIDGIILSITWVGLILFVGLVRFIAHPLNGYRLPLPATWVSGLTVCLLAVLYFTATWSGSGRSIGMHMAGLRMIGPGGEAVGMSRAFIRAVLCVAFPIGFLWLLFSAQNKSLYDIVLSTAVVYDWAVRPHAPPRTVSADR